MVIIAVYRIKRTNKVIRVLSGASCLCEILIYEDINAIPKDLETISKKEAKIRFGETV